MNNMFVSLLLYLTVRFHQQKRLRLTLARAGAFAIGLLSRTPPLLCCVLLLCALKALSKHLPVSGLDDGHACARKLVSLRGCAQLASCARLCVSGNEAGDQHAAPLLACDLVHAWLS